MVDGSAGGEWKRGREFADVVCGMAVAWRGAERGHYVHEAALENLRIQEGTRAARGRGLNKRLNIPSINFKRCKISANSMVGRWSHSFLSTPSSTFNARILYSPLRFGKPESSLKLDGIIGFDVSPGRLALAMTAPYSSSRSNQPTNQSTDQPRLNPKPEPSHSLPVAVYRTRY